MDKMLAITIIFGILILCSSVLHSFGRDIISERNGLRDGETLVSSGKRFELGFFTPAGSSDNRRYVGIWYYKTYPTTVVWVANGDSPLTETGGDFSVDYGDLKVLDKSGKLYWHTNLDGPSNPKFHLDAKLMDSGNLVLRNQSKVNIWQSFEQPTDTFISGMKMHDNLTLTSWASQIDPKPGNFTLKRYQEDVNQLIINRNGYIAHWRSGVSGEFFHSDELPYAVHNLLFNKTSSAPSIYNSIRVVINFTGEIQFWGLDMDENKWSLKWRNPMEHLTSMLTPLLRSLSLEGRIPLKALHIKSLTFGGTFKLHKDFHHSPPTPSTPLPPTLKATS
ncbi:hypothetical protein JCGZ_13813 [Jatropha curcas]|uniref:Bulb-type lectin domain-containing protein n=1 Tax=Jatropha curcas TaxID=180498 RepID=A0A067K7L9_JATCU|nr:hypothetical protein JCGZ_13813 [Jatropha curcas]